ncbi:hypothetical protein CEXT_338301 [Caerostris extrusa]|uniref:Uncharacterized protein n=1 Tax=Caerostris extrusa TaxID=172846 RepID=A0AAV4XHM1_CAEEX|nr:hypothetical protein CEXT_338301 [Caerostris extrusa]
MSFQNAFHVLSKAVIESGTSKTPVNSYLHLILQVDKEVISKRESMLNNHSQLMRKLSNLIDKINDGQSISNSTFLSSTPVLKTKSFSKRKRTK